MPSTRDVKTLRLQLMAARYKERIGERIKEAREARNWTQPQLARMLPGTVDAASISRWETGRVEPRADNLQALADAFGVDPSYFLAAEPAAGTADLLGALRGSDPSQLDRIEAKLDRLLELAGEDRESLEGLVERAAAASIAALASSDEDRPRAKPAPARRRRAS